jgi:hypothetical protein
MSPVLPHPSDILPRSIQNLGANVTSLWVSGGSGSENPEYQVGPNQEYGPQTGIETAALLAI